MPLHTLSVDAIVKLIQFGIWDTPQQSITSAATNTCSDAVDETQNTEGIMAFADIPFPKNTKRVLDIGGGQFDNNSMYLQKEKNINLMVWDPYNRSHAHNLKIQQAVTKQPVDAVTSMSVLNVIPNVEARLTHIATAKAALVLQGVAYFKVWPGEDALRGSYIATASFAKFQANAFPDLFYRECELVFGRNNVKIHESIPNLLVAVKRCESPLSITQISSIQANAKKEMVLIHNKQRAAAQKIYASHPIRMLFSTNLSLFKKATKHFLEDNCLKDSHIQKDYTIWSTRKNI